MQDTELFELCKEVYEKFPMWTGLSQTVVAYYEGYSFVNTSDLGSKSIGEAQYVAPLYTSDYILEKLPKLIDNHDNGGSYYFELGTGSEPWEACYGNGFDQYKHTVGADTPLTALLKLTIALHEAGELK